jgi:glycosyltransferase involved in cell wall biosynthesis
VKVLLLTQVLPYPPDSGPKVKTFYVLKYLARRHEVTLVSFVRGDQAEHIAALQVYCKEIYTVQMQRGFMQNMAALVKSLLGNSPWMMARDDVKEMRQLVDRLAEKVHFDVAHADQLNMAQYALRVQGGKHVLDAHNALWVLYQRLAQTMANGPRRWLLERDWRLLKKYEGEICQKFDQVLTVSEEDRLSFEEAMGGKKKTIHVIPIAVDTDELQPAERDEDARHIIHIGTMYWPPNIDGMMWFLENVLPIIKDRLPEAVCDIIGARPPQQLIDFGKAHPGVNVTGYVVDPAPYLRKAAVMVVPLRAGGGMRVKILNALAQALPIVSTTLGCEGIQVMHGRHLLIADTPEEFAKATVKLIEDPSFARGLGEEGRRLIQEKYDYRTACTPLERIYSE